MKNLLSSPSQQISWQQLFHYYQTPYFSYPPRYWLRQVLMRLFSPKMRQAAVLIAFHYNPKIKGYELLLTKRKANLLLHGGEISFPGGKKEAKDKTPADTAIRETEEEIHLRAQYIHPIATLPPLNTASGYTVYPVLAIIDQLPIIKSGSTEVERLFIIPASYLLSKTNYHFSYLKKWLPLKLAAIDYGLIHIWGLTAEILYYLAQDDSRKLISTSP